MNITGEIIFNLKTNETTQSIECPQATSLSLGTAVYDNKMPINSNMKSAIKFNNSWIQITHNEMSYSENDWTYAAWIYFIHGQFIFYSTSSGAFGLDNAGKDVPSFDVVETKHESFVGKDRLEFSSNVWTHIAIAKKDGIANFFVNGKKKSSSSVIGSFSFSHATNTLLGHSVSPFTGYMNDVILVKNQALWDKDFVIPTSPIAEGEYGPTMPIRIKKLKQY